MRRAQAVGYQISLAYVGIDTPELSRARVDERVAEEVPQAAIVRRHPDSLRRLGIPMSIADSTLVSDNSGLERRLLLHFEEDLARYINDNRPVWFDMAVPDHMRRFPPRYPGIMPGAGIIED